MSDLLLKSQLSKTTLFTICGLFIVVLQNISPVQSNNHTQIFRPASSNGCYVRLPSYNTGFFDQVGDSANNPNVCMARAVDYFNWFRANDYEGPYIVSYYKNGFPTVSRSGSRAITTDCPTGWICLDKPLYTSKIGVWYSVWHRNRDLSNGHFLNGIGTADKHWVASPYQPVLGFYDSADPKVLDTHFDHLGKLGADFLIIDNTNLLNADDYVVASNIESLYKYVSSLPANSLRRQITLSQAVGGGLWATHDIQMQLNEDNWAWDFAYKTFPHLSYQIDGKALLIVHNSYDAALPNNQQCTKTYTPRPCPTAPDWDDSRFSIRRSTGVVSIGNPGVQLSNPYFFPSFDYVYGTTTNLTPMTTTGWWGWVFEYPQFITPETVGVTPGADNTWMSGGKTLLNREHGNYFMKEWLRAIKANPNHIILTSFNEFGDGNAIEPASARKDLSNVPSPQRAIPWTDSYGTEVPDFYLQIAIAYGNLRKGLMDGVSYRDQDSMNVYTAAGETLFLLTAPPPGKPVIVLPAGTIRKLLGGPNPFLTLPPNGTLVQAPGVAPGVMADGKLVLFESLKVAQALSNPSSTITVDTESYYLFPYGGTIRVKSPVIFSDGYPPAFVTEEGEMRPTNCQEAISRNQSTVITIPLLQYGHYPNGGSLHCSGV